MQSARPDPALVPFYILSMHLNVTPELACSRHLLSPKENQKGLFLPDSDCSDPLKIPVERQNRKEQEVSVLISKVGGLILNPNNIG